MPSSFSLIHQPERSAAVSQVSASNSGGPASASPSSPPDATARAGFCGSAPPSRAVSASSPRSRRRCLHVRRSMAVDWFRHAGQVQEYTPPTFLSTYGFAPDPFISIDSPSCKSGMAPPPKRRASVLRRLRSPSHFLRSTTLRLSQPPPWTLTYCVTSPDG